MEKIDVFISYSHEDETYKNNLVKHLVALKRNNIIGTWDDRMIIAGEEWDEEIKKQLEAAKIILLLVSVDFLNSYYSNEVEIKRAIERHSQGEAIVIPIILRKCDWQGTSSSFSKLQALPKDGRPVRSFPDEDEAFYSVVEGIKRAVDSLKKKLSKAEL